MSLSVCGFYAYVIKGYWFCMEMYVLVLIRGIYCAPDVAQYYYAPELVHIFPYQTNNL